MKTRTKQKVERVQKICSACQTGRMEYNGVVQPMNPPNYGHTCSTNCGNEEWLKTKYPYYDYIDNGIETFKDEKQ